MNELLRCPHCHNWTDALLVWASGDCCPHCNGPIGEQQPRERSRETSERVRPPLGLSRPQSVRGTLRSSRLSQAH